MTQIHVGTDKQQERIVRISFESSMTSQLFQDGRDTLELVPTSYFHSLCLTTSRGEDCPALQVLKDALARHFWASTNDSTNVVALSSVFDWLQSSLRGWCERTTRNDAAAQIEQADGLIAILCLFFHADENQALVQTPLKRFLEFTVAIC
jgi:hypothetical protein